MSLKHYSVFKKFGNKFIFCIYFTLYKSIFKSVIPFQSFAFMDVVIFVYFKLKRKTDNVMQPEIFSFQGVSKAFFRGRQIGIPNLYIFIQIDIPNMERKNESVLGNEAHQEIIQVMR